MFYLAPIESVVKEHQQGYYQALEAAGSAGESTPFVEFMLESIHQAMSSLVEEYQKSDQKSNLKSDQKILNLIREDPRITIQELAMRLSMSESGIKKALSKLKNDRRVTRQGGAKGGYWEVTG